MLGFVFLSETAGWTVGKRRTQSRGGEVKPQLRTGWGRGVLLPPVVRCVCPEAGRAAAFGAQGRLARHWRLSRGSCRSRAAAEKPPQIPHLSPSSAWNHRRKHKALPPRPSPLFEANGFVSRLYRNPRGERLRKAVRSPAGTSQSPCPAVPSSSLARPGQARHALLSPELTTYYTSAPSPGLLCLTQEKSLLRVWPIRYRQTLTAPPMLRPHVVPI